MNFCSAVPVGVSTGGALPSPVVAIDTPGLMNAVKLPVDNLSAARSADVTGMIRPGCSRLPTGRPSLTPRVCNALQNAVPPGVRAQWRVVPLTPGPSGNRGLDGMVDRPV